MNRLIYIILCIIVSNSFTNCDTIKSYNFITKKNPKPVAVYANDKHFEQILLDGPVWEPTSTNFTQDTNRGDLMYFDTSLVFDDQSDSDATLVGDQLKHVDMTAEPSVPERLHTTTKHPPIAGKVEKIVVDRKKPEGAPGLFSRINSALRDQLTKLFMKRRGKPDAGEEQNPPQHGGKSDGSKWPIIRAGQKVEGESGEVAEQRFLNIFTIAQFENSRCEAFGVGSNYEGTCYHRTECTNLGGTSMGPCALGYGVCCVFRYGCGGSTQQNTTYFESNPDSDTTTLLPPTTVPPTTLGPVIDPRINTSSLAAYLNGLELFGRQDLAQNLCVLTVIKKTSDVRQLRLDFVDFDLRGPTNGTCLDDRLIISGQNLNSRVPVICGYNTGQHIYVDVSDVAGPIMLQVFTRNPQTRRFKIKVSQIRGACAAPMNCLQYYTGLSGIVQSLNYDTSPRGLGTPQYFNNLNYVICLRKEAGYCTTTYTNVQDGQEYPFQIVNLDSNGVSLIPPNQAGAEIFNCPNDFIVINGIRLCGGKLNDGSTIQDFRLNAPVTDTSGGPFTLPFRTNNSSVGRGFKLLYRQNRCT